MSIKAPFAVSANLFVTPLSFRIFPKNNIPKSGNADGVIKQVNIKPTIGNKIFSSFDTCLGGFILIRRSLSFVSNFIIGG